MHLQPSLGIAISIDPIAIIGAGIIGVRGRRMS